MYVHVHVYTLLVCIHSVVQYIGLSHVEIVMRFCTCPSCGLREAYLLSIVISLLFIILCAFIPNLLVGQQQHFIDSNSNISLSQTSQKVRRIHVDNQKKVNQSKIIIFWTKYKQRRWINKDSWVKCGIYKCLITSNYSLMPYADAVVFRGFDSSLAQDIEHALSNPKPRLTHQYWIYYNSESALRTHNLPINITKYEPVFNLTMTYKLDSDIVYGYGRVVPGKHLDGYDSKRNYLEGRNVTAFAVISNCYHRRLDYIHELQKYMDIDIYGRCHGKPICRKCWGIAKQYKFFLAFENSLCADYVTEKTFANAFTHEVVPVIMSGANLSNPLLIPQGSYINARSYSSPKELATYLMQVSNNSTLYNSFFKWRAKWKIVGQWQYKNRFCSVCEKLYESQDVKIYKNIHNWFNKDKECTEWPMTNTSTV